MATYPITHRASLQNADSPAARRVRIASWAPLCVIYATVGMGLVLVPSAVFMSLPRTLVVWATCLILLALAVLGFCLERSRGRNPWIAPLGLMVLYLFYRYGWGSVIIHYWPDYPWRYNPQFRVLMHRFGIWENLPNGCHLVLIFGVGLALGLTLVSLGGWTLLPRLSWPFDEARLKRSVVIYSPVAALINSVVHFDLPLSIKAGVEMFGSIIYVLIAIVAYWSFSEKNRAQRLKWILLLLIMCAASVPVGLRTSQVTGLLRPFLMIFVGYVIAFGRPPWKLAPLVLPVVLLIVMPLAAIYKSFARFGMPVQQQLADTFTKYEGLNAAARLELSLERSVKRFAGTDLASIYSRYYPEVYPFEYGKTFLFEASVLVPRLLWSEKPYISWEMNRYAAKVGMIPADSVTMVTIDAIAEYYLNFGALGVLVCSVLHGLYFGIAYNWLFTKVQPLIGTAIFASLIVMNEDFFGAGYLFVTHIKTVPVWLILFYAFSRRTSKSSYAF